MEIKIITDWLNENGYEHSFRGNGSIEVSGFSSLNSCEAGKLTWVKKEENYQTLKDHAGVTVAVVQEGLNLDIPNQIVSVNSKEVFFAILHHFWGTEKEHGFIGSGTYISPEAEIDPTAYIGYNCSIVGNVKIGANAVVENNVVIQGNVTIGERTYIQSQTVIGIDGFGYSKDPVTGKKTMVKHFGGVRIGSDVFISSHVNIARGTIDDTIIADGVKIAPTTHIGHNNSIAENATIICSLIYGSVKTGRDAYITASVVQNQTSVGEHTVIGMGSVVTKPIPDNVVAYGIPAKVAKDNNTDL